MKESTPRMSKLQKTILLSTANLIINSNGDRDSEVKYGLVFQNSLKGFGETTGMASAAVSFSRAVHTLIYKHHAMDGLCLAWVSIVVEKGQEYESIVDYAGGGRGKHSFIHGIKERSMTPRFKMLGLTDTGWALVEAIKQEVER